MTDAELAPSDGEQRARWLHTILRGDLLSVAFQPIVNLLTGDVFLYEVLGRAPPTLADEPDYTPLGPLEWLDVAQSCGLLLDLDRAWRRRAVEEVARSHGGTSSTCFSLNVDPRIIDDPRFGSGYTRELVDQSQLSAARFVLEITESGAHLGDGRAQAMISHFAAQGFRIALDDLGTGYASLSALVNLRPHVLKLDKDVIVGLATDPVPAHHLVRALADFSRRSGMQFIAEGVETEADLIGLLRAGVVFGQGFFIASPGPQPVPPSSETRTCIRARAAEVERTRFHSIGSRRIAEIASAHSVLHPSVRGKEVERRFRADPLNDGFPRRRRRWARHWTGNASSLPRGAGRRVRLRALRRPRDPARNRMDADSSRFASTRARRSSMSHVSRPRVRKPAGTTSSSSCVTRSTSGS